MFGGCERRELVYTVGGDFCEEVSRGVGCRHCRDDCEGKFTQDDFASFSVTH